MGEHDGILLERWSATGDQQAFMELVTRYQGMMFGVCVRILKDHAKAEDMVQECFLKLTRTQPKNVNVLGPWLHRVATNSALNQLTSERRRQTREKKYSEHTDAGYEHSWDDIYDILDEELSTLSIEHREVIVAHFLEGLKQSEVAERLGVTRQTVSKRTTVALDVLQRNLKSRGVLVPAAALSGLMTSNASMAAPASLAEAMGKLVLTGTFRPAVAATGFSKVLPIASVLLCVVTGLIVLYFGGQADDSEILPVTEEVETAVARIAAEEIPPLADEQTMVEHTTGDEALITRVQCVDEDGIPVAGASVYVYQRSGYPIPLAWGWDKRTLPHRADGPLVTDAGGYFEIPFYKPEDSKGGYRFAYAVLSGKKVGMWSGRGLVGTPEGQTEKTLVMASSRTVRGNVSIPDEVNMAHVRLEAISILPKNRNKLRFKNPNIILKNTFPGMFETALDAQGNFEFTDVPVGGGISFRGYGPGLGDAHGGGYSTEVDNPIEMKLTGEGVIEGTVRYLTTKTAVAGRMVFCRNKTPGAGTIAHRALTDAFGRYRFDGLGPGLYDVVVGMETHPPKDIARSRSKVEVESGFVTENIDLVVEKGVLIRGTTTSKEDGAPLEGIGVAAVIPDKTGFAMNSTTSDENGHYELRLPLGNTKLYIPSMPYGISRLSWSDERTFFLQKNSPSPPYFDFQFDMKPESGEFLRTIPQPDENSDYSTAITGLVFDKNRTPLAGVLITLSKRVPIPGGKNWVSKSITGITDAEGKYLLPMTPDAPYEIIVGGKGWSAWRGEEFNSKPGEVREIDDVVLERFSAEVSFEVVNEDGRPIAHTQYAVVNKNYYCQDSSRKADSKGFIFLEELPNETLNVRFYRDGYERQRWIGEPGQHLKVVMKRK